MSGESQRWLQDEPVPPVTNSVRPIRLRVEAGELSPPHGHLSLAGVADSELRRSFQLDELIDSQLQTVPLVEGLESRLHALIDTFVE